jgi:hypothetical protein
LLPPNPCRCRCHSTAACRPKAAKAEIRLTPGKGVQDLTCTVEELVDQVVKACKVGGRWGGCNAALVAVLSQMPAEMLGIRLGRQLDGQPVAAMEA